MMTSRRPLVTLFSILVLVSLACTLPALGGATPTPTTPSASPTPPAATPVGGGKPLQQPDLPPVLVETDPPAGSEIAPSAAMTFYFNQPMQRASVESAFQVQPAQTGKFEWKDDSTLRFVADKPFTAGADVKVDFAASLKAANGLAGTDPVSLQFTVADSLRVTDRLPKPGATDANPSSAIVATFNTPVVALGADPAGLAPAFTLQPEAKGRGEWLNTSTYIFYPEPALAGGVAYAVTLDPALTSADGVPLDLSGLDPQGWTFTTALPRVVNLSFGDVDRLELDGKVTLTFNQPMDTASVDQNLSLLDPAGTPAPLNYTWDERGTQVVFQPEERLARATDYTIRLAGAARSLGGAPVGEDYTYVQTSVPALAVESTAPAAGELLNANYGMAYLQINFTAPLDQQDLTALVTVSPLVSGLHVGASFDRYSLTIDGGFQPSTNYTIQIASALRDRWGGTLAAPVSLRVTTDTPPPSLTIPVAQIGSPAIFIPAGETVLDVRITNVSQAILQRRTLSVDDFIMLASSGDAAPTGSNPVSWTQNFDAPQNRSIAAALRVDPNNQPLPPGVYWFKVSAPGAGENADRSYLLISSRVHLTLKLSPRQAVVWAVDLVTNQPAAGLPVSIRTFGDPSELGTCVTGNDGVCSAEIAERKETYNAVYAVAGQPG
ncbi:MAG TPA: Ig-like domain-containing protein, partial [Anaerolinea sp.]|nr:Ig-like domain-containing protein [Anaerolinea sp.]